VVVAGVVPAVNWRKWLKEPLVHFLLAGLALFAATAWWQGPNDQGRTIRVTRGDLLTYLQGRAQVYDQKTFAAMLGAMSDKDRRALVHDAALQEALYREGSALDLATADPLIRQRIVQQMRLLVMEEAATGATVSDAEVAAFYRDHEDDYRLPADATFTHVFFNAVDRGAAAEGAAKAELAVLRRTHAPFERAGEHGDRFLYQLNYAEADQALVASHFGEAFAKALFRLPIGTWQGPLRSQYGWHLVLVRERNAGGLPAFTEIAGQVREDALADKRAKLAGEALDRLLAQYRIVPGPGVAK
jgi:hypothetical protein